MAWLISREEWLKIYGLIVERIPWLSFQRDQEATDLLSHILVNHPRAVLFEDIKSKIKSSVSGIVVGCGGSLLRETGFLKTIDKTRFLIVAADGATRVLLENGVVPDLIVTDLDGDIEAIRKASRMGSITIIHAHGDNIDLLEKHVPLIEGFVSGSTQVEPRPYVYNYGGFTDGDRALFILYHLGVREVYLAGFDLEEPGVCPGKTRIDLKSKIKKLEIARLIMKYLEEKGVVFKHIGELHE